MSTNAYNPRLTNWDVLWGAYNLGLLNKVTPDLKMAMKPIKRGTTGEAILGHFFTALEGSIKVMVPDIVASTIVSLCPWMTTGSNQVLTPAVMNTNLYTYAALLNLHPHDLPAGTTTEDMNFPKAVPTSLFNMSRDGQDEKMAWEVTFMIYPDISKLTQATPELVYGWLGATTPSADA